MSGVNAYGRQKKTDSFRRNWDSELYDKKARDREQQSKLDEEDAERRRKGLKPRSQQGAAAMAMAATKQPRELLQARKQAVNLEGMIGRVQVVQASATAAGQPGFYCKVCDVTVKDSLTYLDHINGKNHQRMLNRSMSVARETVDDVLAKLQALRDARRRQQEQSTSEYSFHDQVRRQQQLDADRRQRRKDAQRRRRQERAGSGDDNNNDSDNGVGSMMGFAAFGSSKKR